MITRWSVYVLTEDVHTFIEALGRTDGRIWDQSMYDVRTTDRYADRMVVSCYPSEEAKTLTRLSFDLKEV